MSVTRVTSLRSVISGPSLLGPNHDSFMPPGGISEHAGENGRDCPLLAADSEVMRGNTLGRMNNPSGPQAVLLR